MKDNLIYPKRKSPRLTGYDYSTNGYYFITICCYKKQCFLGSVGQGLAPAEKTVKLSKYGLIAEKHLLSMEQRFPSVKIDNYKIMPNHIHAIVIIENNNETAGASPRPTLSDVVCAFKSLTTRECNQISNTSGRKLFQNSFYDEIITTQRGYEEIWNYIENNQYKWQNDEYYF